MPNLHYEVIYRNGDKKANKIADFWRAEDGRFYFRYVEHPKTEFPGFAFQRDPFIQTALWEQIALRVPNQIRAQYKDLPLESLLHYTAGKIVTDNFEFLKVG